MKLKAENSLEAAAAEVAADKSPADNHQTPGITTYDAPASDDYNAPAFDSDEERDGGSEGKGGDGAGDPEVGGSESKGGELGADGQSGGDHETPDDARTVSIEEHRNLQAALREARNDTKAYREFVQRMASEQPAANQPAAPEREPQPAFQPPDMDELERLAETDGRAAFQQLAQSLGHLYERLNEGADRVRERNQAAAAEQQRAAQFQAYAQERLAQLQSLEEQAASSDDTYYDRAKFVLDRHAAMIEQNAKYTGRPVTAQYAQQMARQAAQQTLFQAMDAGQDPVEYVKFVSDQYGYQRTAADDAKGDAQSDVARIKAGQKAAKGFGSGHGKGGKKAGDGPSLARIANAKRGEAAKEIEAYMRAAKEENRARPDPHAARYF